MKADDPRHGEPRGYYAHKKAGQKPCPACRKAVAAKERQRRYDAILGRPRGSVPALGTARRVRALVALGYTFGQIGDALGRSHDYARKLATYEDERIWRRTADDVAAVFRQMAMVLPPNDDPRDQWRVSYAKTTAAKNGWSPPLAWDDIDNPDEQPRGIRRTFERRDLLTEWAELQEAGESIDQAARRLGVTVKAIEKARERRSKEDAA